MTTKKQKQNEEFNILSPTLWRILGPSSGNYIFKEALKVKTKKD